MRRTLVVRVSSALCLGGLCIDEPWICITWGARSVYLPGDENIAHTVSRANGHYQHRQRLKHLETGDEIRGVLEEGMFVSQGVLTAAALSSFGLTLHSWLRDNW